MKRIKTDTDEYTYRGHHFFYDRRSRTWGIGKDGKLVGTARTLNEAERKVNKRLA